MIALLGSVFSPYYAAARRRGAADPLNHCALNVALYGERRRWAMTERGRGQLQRNASSLHIGPSSLHWDGSALTIRIDELTAPWPSRVRGALRVEVDRLHDAQYSLEPTRRHHWWPIAPRARVQLALDKPALKWQGQGYLDSNFGDEPLEDAFSGWTWSRSTLPRQTSVMYDLQRRDGSVQSLALQFNDDGAARGVTAAPMLTLPRSRWGIARNTRAASPHAARLVATLEDGPFYARSMLTLDQDGEAAATIHESLSLDRFRQRWVQWLLPLRMPRVGG